VTRPGPRSRLGDLTGWALALTGCGYAALLHYGIGPGSGDGERLWSQPSGWLLEWLAASSLAPLGEDVRLGLAVLTAPAAALALAVALVTRLALPRVLALAAFVACALFAFYGIQAPVVWRFFDWRWSAAMLLFSAIVAATALSPLLAARWLRLGWPARIALYAPIFVGVVLLERNVTGTDPALPFSISPWPAVQVFGLEVAASILSALILGVAGGLALLDLAGGRGPASRGGVAIAGAVVAGAFPSAPLGLGAAQGLLPFQPGARLLLATAAAAALSYVVAGWSAGDRRRRRTYVWAVAGLLAGLPLLTGQVLTRVDYETTRSRRAPELIEALDAFYAREGSYPEQLAELREAGDLRAVPRPQVGFAFLAAPDFGYQSFGTSYLLEFSAPRWIQCAYSPPYEDDFEEEGLGPDDFEEEGLGPDDFEEEGLQPDDFEEEGLEHDADELDGAWSCPSRPPELW